MCQFNLPVFLSVITVVVSIATFTIGYSQFRIASAKTKLDLYNKRFNIYAVTLDYYQSTLWESHDKIKEKSIDFVVVFRESKFLFEINDGVYAILEKIQKNASLIHMYKEHKYERENNLTSHNLGLDNLRESSNKAQMEFGENMLILEKRIEKYINFKTITGWKFL